LRKLLSRVAAIVILTYCLFYLFYIWFFAVDFPIQDDLLFILLVDDFQKTEFTLYNIPYFIGELFRVDNDHCLMVPRIIILISFWVTNVLNFKDLLVFVSFLSLGTLTFFYAQFRTFKKPFYYFLPVVFLLLQPQYYEVSLWTLSGLEHTGVILFLLASLFSVKNNKIWLGLLFASAGTFTSGNGIFTFAVVGLFFVLECKYRSLLPLFGVFLLNVIVLLFIYKKGQQNNLSESLNHLPELFKYYLFLLGGVAEGFTMRKIPAIAFGTFLLVSFIYLTIKKLMKPTSSIASYALAFMAFNLVTILLIALGRFDSGTMVTASRYQYYAVLVVIGFYLLLISLKLNSVLERVVILSVLGVSLIFNFLSYFNHTTTIDYNKSTYLADTQNWSSNENMFYVSPSFVNLVRPYFAETVENEIWVPKHKLYESTFGEDLKDIRISIFADNFQSGGSNTFTDKNNFVLEVAGLPISPSFQNKFYLLLTELKSRKRHILSIHFLDNGKYNFMTGKGYLRNFGYAKAFQGTLEKDVYDIEVLYVRDEKITIYDTGKRINIFAAQVELKHAGVVN
jgi:hypothetical protein